ncbi:ArnT family glycosyltransferase [Shewanella cyperi]|uniref:ArnT family glycosyltransferase n=1 Tax=Shewanella cyperi TaxID=2814292 RepID=UPI001A94F243|nr:glycosyltransferase family 39 protein [Shewanella cyperi]QSX41230.1 glycosyltransferase family 39 protein [Shewanella cyperi]
MTQTPPTPSYNSPQAWLCATLVAALMLALLHLWLRPLTPVDETRYISVAWEMWRDNSLLVPLKNGEPYAHKTPLLFWLIQLSWALFGVSEWAARLAVSLINCGNYVLLFALARRYYPQTDTAARYAPVLLFSLAGWNLYSSMLMFDQLLSLFVLTWALACLHYSERGLRRFIALAAATLGLGLLAKGPVFLLYALPFAALQGLWRKEGNLRSATFFRGLAMALPLGLALFACWLIPAVIAGGSGYENELIWKQTTGRMVQSFDHARPFYWYLLLLPVMLLPLPLLRGIWRAVLSRPESGCDRALLLYGGFILVSFSLISGKQVHYLTPLLPFVALYIGNRMGTWQAVRQYPLAVFALLIALLILGLPWWAGGLFGKPPTTQFSPALALLPLVLALPALFRKPDSEWARPGQLLLFPMLISCLLVAIRQPMFDNYDMTPLATRVQQLQQEGQTLAFWGSYDAQFQFAGRLQQPLVELQQEEELNLAWLEQHPDTLVIYPSKRPDPVLLAQALYHQPYRSGNLLLLQARQLLAAQAITQQNPAQNQAQQKTAQQHRPLGQ